MLVVARRREHSSDRGLRGRSGGKRIRRVQDQDLRCDPGRLGAQLSGFEQGGRLVSLCYSGANLVPVQATPAAVAAFADRALRQGRRCSSLVGPSAAVSELWRTLRQYWGPARDVRPAQPLMAIDGPPRVAPDPAVRRVRVDEIDILLPASISMFTEEVCVSANGKLADRILFLGQRNDVGAILCAVDGIVINSRREPFGLIALEALAAGKPIVAAKVDGIPELIQDKVTGLLTAPGDRKALVSGLRTLYSCPDLCQELSSRGRLLVEKTFDCSHYVRAIETLYGKALEHSVLAAGQSYSRA